jgi:uncharacterized protein (TIGR00299 family) protein
VARALYFDCFSGCSGDMLLGALLDSGFELEKLRRALSGLPLAGYSLAAEKVMRSSIAATKFKVVLEDFRPQPRRGLSEILALLESARLPAAVKKKSTEIFRHLAEVEAAIHNVAIEDVHFHELGGLDSIIDILGAVFVLDALKIERCYASPLPLGSGKIKSAHGILPAPAPATLKLLALAGAPLIAPPGDSSAVGELVTPTGAALLSAYAVFRRPELRIREVGYGAGGQDLPDWPNVMRVWIGEEISQSEEGDLVLLETNIDDMNPQIYGYLLERLLGEKAADVWFTPIQMKKNRPAVMLSVLAPAIYEGRLAEIILAETSTLGIRSRRTTRHVAERRSVEVATSLGTAHAKIKSLGGSLSIFPEYEDCRRIAAERGLPLQEVSRIIELETRRFLESQS